MIEVGWQERQPAWSPIPTHALINRQWLPTASFHRTHSWVSYSVFFCPIFLASPWRVLPNSPLPLATRNLRVLFPQLRQALSSFPSRAISIYPSGASSENSWLNGPLLFVPYRIFTSHWKYLSKSSDAQHHQLNAIGDPGTQYIHITFLDRLVTSHFQLFAAPWTVAHQAPLCPWASPGKNTGTGCHTLLQGFFLSQGSNTSLLHCRPILYCLSHQGSPILHWILLIIIQEWW